MRMTRTLTLAATLLAGAAMTAPAARAHEGRAAGRGGVAVVVRGHTPRCTWLPAHRETRVERVLLRPGFWREVTVPAVTRTVLDLRSWRLVRVVVRPATTRLEWVPPEWGLRRTVHPVPGRWSCAGHRHC